MENGVLRHSTTMPTYQNRAAIFGTVKNASQVLKNNQPNDPIT
jgi:hypothetical protein